MMMKSRMPVTVALIALCSATFDATARAEDDIEKLLETMPADVGVIVLVDRPSQTLPPKLLGPLVGAIAPNELAQKQVLEAIKRIPGPFVIGWVPPRGFEMSKDSGILIAIEMNRPDEKFEDWCEERLLPAWRSMLRSSATSALTMEPGERSIRIFDRNRDEMVLAFAMRDRIAFGATKANRVLRWRRDEYPKSRWIDKPGSRRLCRSLSKDRGIRVIVNPHALLTAAEVLKPEPNSLAEIALSVLSPTDVESVSLELTWEKQTISLRANLAMKEGCRGLPAWLMRPGSKSTALGALPDDFCAVGRFGWSSASRALAGVYELTDLFDKTIGQEYLEDLATFKATTGVDWDGEFLGQLVNELVFGVRVDFTRKSPVGWAAVCPLGNSAAFNRQLDQLVTQFELPVRIVERDGLRIHVGGAAAPFAFASAKNHFVLADSPETLMDVAQCAAGRSAEPANKSIRQRYAGIEASNHFALMLDLQMLVKKAPFIPFTLGPRLGTLMSSGTASLALWSRDRMATLELVWDLGRPRDLESKESKDDATPLLIAMVEAGTEAVIQSRQEALRIQSMYNLRGIGQAIQICAMDSNGEFPASLEDLLRLAPNSITLSYFRNPYNEEGPESFDELTEKSYIIYRPGLSTKSPPDEVLLAERAIFNDNNGACFVFVDGHVEFIAEPRASELIELMKSGAESVKR
ncbi:MAG: hypothetical protein KF841_04060 [Phycisphaerae bacterium]|nr:hypothetical protein [Phycisphaerae bacterium]